MRAGFALDHRREKDDEERRFLVMYGEDLTADVRNRDRELLVQFARYGGKISFQWFALAARELPESTVSLLWWAQADEIAVPSLYYGSYDPNESRDSRSNRVMDLRHVGGPQEPHGTLDRESRVWERCMPHLSSPGEPARWMRLLGRLGGCLTKVEMPSAAMSVLCAQRQELSGEFVEGESIAARGIETVAGSILKV
jgi:hypothetical protein